eukprot:SAG31_NODE_1277_length_9041_cov_22.545627_8_plen_156_part_00
MAGCRPFWWFCALVCGLVCACCREEISQELAESIERCLSWLPQTVEFRYMCASASTTVRPAHKQQAHKWFSFVTQSSPGVEPGLLQHVQEVGRLMEQGFMAVLKALGDFDLAEVDQNAIAETQNDAFSVSNTTWQHNWSSSTAEPPTLFLKFTVK